MIHFHLHLIKVQSLDMFRALLAHRQEALHERRFGDYCVLKLIVSLCHGDTWYMWCRMICTQYVPLVRPIAAQMLGNSPHTITKVSHLLSTAFISKEHKIQRYPNEKMLQRYSVT
jgi:hypothetical protein